MKETEEYVKTRGQRIASQQIKAAPYTELVLTNIQKKSTSSSAKDQSEQKHLQKTSKKKYLKTKTITKTTSGKKKKEGKKQKKPKIIKNIKSKKLLLKQMNHTKFPSKQLDKLQKKKNKLKRQKIKNSLEKLKLEKKLAKSLLKMNGINYVPKQKIYATGPLSSSTNQKLNKLSLIKAQIKKLKKQQQKIKTKVQNNKNINQSSSKAVKSNLNHQSNNQALLTEASKQPIKVSTTNLISQPQVQVKKKGRPRKIITEPRLQPRSNDEQKILDDFIQNTIKFRKVKNEKEFFQCFSRITQYVKQSWEYGDLGKQLSSIPRSQDILKIGIPIVRGIRKQLQQQYLNQIV